MDAPLVAASEQDGGSGTLSPIVALERQGEALTQAMAKKAVMASASRHDSLPSMHVSEATWSAQSLVSLGTHLISHLPGLPVRQEHHAIGLCKRECLCAIF